MTGTTPIKPHSSLFYSFTLKFFINDFNISHYTLSNGMLTNYVDKFNMGKLRQKHLSIRMKPEENQETLFRNDRSPDLPDAH